MYILQQKIQIISIFLLCNYPLMSIILTIVIVKLAKTEPSCIIINHKIYIQLSVFCSFYFTPISNYFVHFSASENLDELSSSSSWLLNQKHSKKRRKDRTRLKSPSLAIMSTAARTRPLQSFHKRKLYRLSPTFYWTPEVRLHLGNHEQRFHYQYFFSTTGYELSQIFRIITQTDTVYKLDNNRY